MKRREFIQNGIQSIAGLYALSSIPHWAYAADPKKKQIFIAGGNDQAHILWMELDTGKQLRVKAPVMPHSFLQHPSAEKTVVVIEKAGSKAAVCDFQAGKTQKLIQCPKGFEFYGHGVFSGDGKSLYITRVDNSTGIGYLASYDAKTYREQGQVQVAPGGVHDLHLLSDKKTLLVSSSGLQVSSYSGSGPVVSKPRIEKSSVVHLDLETGKVKSKLFLGDEDQVVGHFAVSSDERKVVAISVPFVDGHLNDVEKGKGGIYTASMGGTFKKIEMPTDIQKKIRGELLSVAIDADKDRFYATNPNGKMLFEVQNSTDKLVKAHDFHVNGLAIWKGDKEDTLLMNPTINEPGKDPIFAKDVGSGRDVAFKMPTQDQFISPHLLIISI